ncbi:MAG: copper chaperone PCu(A)C [Rhodospirillaceae bacterium]
MKVINLVRDSYFFLFSLSTALISGSSYVAADPILMSNAWMRETIGQSTVTAGYLTITNSGEVSDQLSSIRAEGVAKIEIHKMTLSENGMMGMKPLYDLRIPAGETVLFEGGSDHLMLSGVSSPLKEGDRILVIFTFLRAGEIPVLFQVSRRPPP